MIEAAVVMPRLFAEGAGNLRVQLRLETGSLTALIGPSGSGKTTLLRILAGLETPQQGRIAVGEQTWLDLDRRINLPPQRRSIGYVFQDTALFPNLNVRENMAYGAPSGSGHQLTELVELTGLAPFIHKKPAVLSGGQRQRVALARALIRRPQLLLLDEPFAALDAEAAGALRRVLLQLHRELGTTTVLVSHHETDVRTLADRVIQLVQGRVQSEEVPSRQESGLVFRERINQVWFDQDTQQWVVKTDTAQLQSANPQWSQLEVGSYLEFNYPA